MADPSGPVRPAPPVRVVHEWEHGRAGSRCRASTVFLVGARCPFACVFCDLGQYTVDGPTPAGAITAQLEWALAQVPHRDRIKLYNASNFFDDQAIPPAEDDAIAQRLHEFDEVVVECHPRLVGDRCVAFAKRLSGHLQVALGLETVHAGSLERLNKGMTLGDFDGAARRLRHHAIGLRAFVLVGVPFLAAADQTAWTRRTVDHAVAQGATHVSLIPVRAQDELARLATTDQWRPTTLGQFESIVAEAIRTHGTRAQADLWDLDQLSTCPTCLPARRRRLEAMNRDGRVRPAATCSRCKSDD